MGLNKLRDMILIEICECEGWTEFAKTSVCIILIVLVYLGSAKIYHGLKIVCVLNRLRNTALIEKCNLAGSAALKHFVTLIDYVYMSSNGPQKQDNQFWCHLLRLHGQFCVVSLPYMDNEWSGSERYLLSQHPERANGLATERRLVMKCMWSRSHGTRLKVKWIHKSNRTRFYIFSTTMVLHENIMHQAVISKTNIYLNMS